MSVYIARFGVDMYTIPLWEMASGRHHVLVKATDRNLAWMWVEARDALGGPAECRPPYRSVCYLRKLLTIEEWGVDCFAIQPMAGRAAAPDLREPDCIAVNLAGAIYDGNFGWIGRVEQWTGLCTARELVKGLVVLLQTDQDALYGPEGCDIPWDYGAASLGGYASGWLGRQR
jgi:hypothetical protein